MERDKLGRFGKGSIPWNKGVMGYSNSKKGKRRVPTSGFQKGHKNYNLGGNKWSMASRIKLSLAQTGEKDFTGFKRKLRARIMMMREYLKWRADVFKRDNYHCQNCGEKGYLEAHHIIPFAKITKIFKIKTIDEARTCKELWDIGNGISYCEKCHILLDNNIGKRGPAIKLELNNKEVKKNE